MLSSQKLPHAVVSDAPDPRPIRLRYSQNLKISYQLLATSF